MKVSFEKLSPQSKLWIYSADRFLTDNEMNIVLPQLHDFLEQWSSHGSPILNFGDIYHHKFLVLFADETRSYASGCSIDKSVHFITELGQQIGINFFERMQIQYLEDDQLISVPGTKKFKELINDHIVNEDTLIFDHTVKDKAQFENEWIKPLKYSWLKRYSN
jgi:hypothetical protein